MFYISISNGLLKDNHRKRMGEAVWEFMWLLDKVTKIDDKGIGWVLGGKPIKLDDVVKDQNVCRVTVSRNLNKLEKLGYITLIHTPYGISIRVMKAKKRFNTSVKVGLTEVLNLHDIYVKPNKTVSVDSISMTMDVVPTSSLKAPNKKDKMPPEYVNIDDDGNQTVKRKGIKKPVAIRQDEFNHDKVIAEMFNAPQKTRRIIALYFQRRGWRFENWEQFDVALARELKPASLLKGYSGEQISKSMDYCENKWDNDWTLETVGRWINQAK